MIKEFQWLKEAENDVKKIEWDAKRFLSKNNYLIQTDAVKNYLIPSRNYKENLEWLAYAEEAVVYTYRIPFLMILGLFICVSVAALDGFYKEYNKSLVCLSEFQMNGSPEQLQEEFFQGVSAHPAHIRLGLDFKRNHWLQEIHEILENTGVALVKGVSGQGKSALCYRYLLETYPEGVVFCIRTIATEGQAQNLVSALDGLGKYNRNLIIYIDVQPGETLWAF